MVKHKNNKSASGFRSIKAAWTGQAHQVATAWLGQSATRSATDAAYWMTLNIIEYYMKDIEILEPGKPIPEYKDKLAKGLHAYNASVIGEQGHSEQVTGFARDKSGEIVGGVYGELGWGWLHIHWLWCAETVRRGGVGSKLLNNIEEYANKRGVEKYRLETTEFQALEFYKKNGYTVFGELNDLPPGYKSYFLKKEI